MSRLSKYLITTICFSLNTHLIAHNVQGTNALALDNAIKAANANVGLDSTVVIQGSVFMNDQVRALGAKPNFTWDPNAILVTGVNDAEGIKPTLTGEGNNRGFFVGGKDSTAGLVTIQNLNFNELRAKGGDGNGGGMGAGGALFVGKNTQVFVENCGFLNC